MHSLFDANLAIINKAVMGLHNLEAILSLNLLFLMLEDFTLFLLWKVFFIYL